MSHLNSDFLIIRTCFASTEKMLLPAKATTVALCAAGICANFGEAVFLSSSTVLWAESTKTKVANKFDETQVKIDLVSPCDVLATLYPKKLKHEARIKCNAIYENLISQEISDWCPKRKRKERFIVMGLLALGFVVAMGLGGLALHTSYANSEMIRALGENEAGQQEMMTKMEEQIENAHYKMDNFTQKYNLLVSKLQRLAHEHEELSGTLVNVVMESSSLISQLTVKKMQIRQAKRLWKDSIIHPDLFDIFDVEMPCGEHCPLELAKPIGCELNGNNELVLRLLTPFVNKDLVVMESFPFELLTRQGSNICSKKYVGPERVIMSKNEKCVVNNEYKGKTDGEFITIVSNYTCVEEMNYETLFNVTNCVNSTENDYKKFVQVKFLGNQMSVYCPESTYTINKITRPCENSVMIFSSFQPLQINGEDVFTNQMNLTVSHVENAELSDAASHVVKTVDTYDFSSTIFNETSNFQHLNLSDFVKHPIIFYGGPGLLLVLLICIAAFVCYKVYFKKPNRQQAMIL